MKLLARKLPQHKDAEATLRKKKRGIAGAFRRIGGGGTIEKYRDLAQKARLEVEDLRKGLLSDIAKQSELQAIRRKRKSAVEETISGMTRKLVKLLSYLALLVVQDFLKGILPNARNS